MNQRLVPEDCWLPLMVCLRHYYCSLPAQLFLLYVLPTASLDLRVIQTWVSCFGQHQIRQDRCCQMRFVVLLRLGRNLR